MDPLSITASAGSIFGALISCTKDITSFVSTVRTARTEMDAVQRELTSLKLCLEMLEDDDEQYRVCYPDEMRIKIGETKMNIEMNCNQIRNMLNKLQSGKLGRRIQWAAAQREEINQFRSSLEANKANLELMLQLGTIAIITRSTKGRLQSNRDVSAVLQYAQATSDSTTEISRKMDDLLVMQEDCSRFDELRHELARLRQQMTALDTPKHQSFHYFLDQSRLYAQALLESLDPPPGYEDCLSMSEPTIQKHESGDFDDSASTLVAPSIVINDVDEAAFCPACVRGIDDARLRVAQARIYEMQKQWRTSWTEQLIHELACLQPADVISARKDAHCADSLSLDDNSHIARLAHECDELRLHSQQLMGEIRSLQQRSADRDVSWLEYVKDIKARLKMAGIKQTELQKDVEQKALHMTDLKDMLDNSKKAQRRLQAERSRELDELRNMSLLNLEQKQMSITELRRRLQVAEEQTQSLVEEVTRVNKESATTRLEWANDVERLEAIHHEQIQEKVTLADRLQQELTQAVQLQQSLTDANKEQRRRLDCAITEQTQERQRLQEKLHQADCELEKQQSLREAHEHTGAGKGVQPGISRSGMQHRPFERNSPIPLIEFRVHERPVQGLCLRLKSFVTEARPLDIQAAREPHKIQGLMTDMLDRQKVKDMSFGMHKSIAEIERLTVGMCRDVLEELEYDDEGSFLQIGSLRLVQRTRVSYYGLGAGQTIWLMLLPKAVGRSTVSGYEEEGLTYTDPDTRDLSLLSFDDMRFTNQLRSVEDDGEDSERTVEEYRHEEEDETEYEDEPEKIVRNRTSSFRTQPVVEVVVVQVKPPSRFIYLRPKSYVPCSQELAQCGYDPSTKVPEFMTKMVRHHLEHGKFFAQSDRVKELESNIRFVTSPMPEIPFQSEGGSFLQLGYRRLKPSDKISSLWLKDGDSIWLMQRPLRTGRSGKLMKDKYMTFEDPAKQQHVLLPFHDPKLVKHPGAEQNRQKLIYVRQAFTPSDPI